MKCFIEYVYITNFIHPCRVNKSSENGGKGEEAAYLKSPKEGREHLLESMGYVLLFYVNWLHQTQGLSVFGVCVCVCVR